jgi:hypothetical protein
MEMNLQFLEGILLKDAERMLYIRVIKEDGVNYLGTCDFNPLRINVSIIKGQIDKVLSVG